MVFKRRDRRPLWRVLIEFLWPRGGWGRAVSYIRHRLNRLPDTPEKICRGIWAGVFTTFTPFYGFHFIFAAILGRVMRGNIIAALLSTFFGNPLTYVPIGIVSLNLGHRLLGTRPEDGFDQGILKKFGGAGSDLWHNFISVFTTAEPHWDRLERFYDDVFLPYMVGGIMPGIVVATLAYYLALPLVRAYQNRRKSALKAKLAQLRKPPEGVGS